MKTRIAIIAFLISFLVIIFCSRSRYVKSIDGNLCKRTCVNGDRRICHYNFCGSCSHTNYSTCFQEDCILGDFKQKGVMSINRRVPGPDIQVCQNDRIIIDVVNQAPGTAAALHWHGLHMREAPFMDGVPFITQCPIMFGTSFRYDFPASEVGTFFYHSHSGLHKMNGQHGALIIREPKDNDPHKDLYDFDHPEHYIILSDWVHGYAEDYFPGFGTTLLNGILINGISHNLSTSTGVVKTFYVEKGRRHRFRLIDSVGFGCSVQLRIESHKLTVIAADGSNVFPKEVDSIHINSGERFDFVLRANNYKKKEYWIRARALGNCESYPESFAVLKYVDNLEGQQEHIDYQNLPMLGEFPDDGLEINNPETIGKGHLKDLPITELASLYVNKSILEAVPDYRFTVSVDDIILPEDPGQYHNYFVRLGNVATYGAFNNISFAEQHFPLLTQSEEINQDTFCDDRNLPDRCHGKDFCFCTHRLKVRLNSIVEVTLLGTEEKNFMNHPIHLHGSHFYITGIGSNSSSISYERQTESPPYKDTLSVPGSGYAIIRFKADNPGFWFFHCHYDYHHAAGMSAVFQVGELSEMNKGPKDFPKCGNYLPDIEY